MHITSVLEKVSVEMHKAHHYFCVQMQVLYAFGFHGDNTIGNATTLEARKFVPGQLAPVPSWCLPSLYTAHVMTLPNLYYDLMFAAACCNLCRDEVTATLKHKLDAVFGSSFNTNGLGAVLTCGTTGLTAGLSHAPVSAVRWDLLPLCFALMAAEDSNWDDCATEFQDAASCCCQQALNSAAGRTHTGLCFGICTAKMDWHMLQGSGKERYVFFSFPHIGIGARGSLGTISRPGRPGASSACGALKAALGDIQGQGLAASCSCPGGGVFWWKVMGVA